MYIFILFFYEYRHPNINNPNYILVICTSCLNDCFHCPCLRYQSNSEIYIFLHYPLIHALPMEVRACLSETLSHKLLNPLRFKHIMSNLLAYVDNEMSPSDFITKARKEYMWWLINFFVCFISVFFLILDVKIAFCLRNKRGE